MRFSGKKNSLNTLFCSLLIVFLFLILNPEASQAVDEWDPNMRPIKLVSKNRGELVLENVRWGMKFDGREFQTIFKQTRIRPELVKEVFYCVEAFPPKLIADHALIVFIFSSLDGVVASDNSKDIGLAISVTNRTRRNESGSALLKSFMPRRAKNPWPILYEVGTFKDRLQTSLIKLERTMRLHRLDIPQPMKEAVLRAGLELSLIDHSRDFYHLLQNNCIVHAVKIIQKGLKDSFDLEMWNFRNFLLNPSVALPKLSMYHLQKKHLLNKKPWIIKPENEFVYAPTSQDYQVQLSSLPGYLKAPEGLLSFAQLVRAFQEREFMFDDVNRLQLLLSPSDPRYLQTLSLAKQLNAEQSDIWQNLLQAIHKNPEKLIKEYIIWLEHPTNSHQKGLKRLNEMFIGVLKHKIALDHTGKRKKSLGPMVGALINYSRR